MHPVTTMFFSVFLMLLAVGAQSLPAMGDVRSQIKKGTSGFQDITLVSRVLYSNINELKKVSKDFANTYEFKSITLQYKNPDKMRADAKLGMVGFCMIINGDQKGFRIPIRGWQKENIKGRPHKRQTDLDLGIITESLWQDYVVTDTTTEGDTYKITFAWSNSKDKKQVCWVDADTLKLLKRQRFEKDGRLIATYVYSEHKKVGGIWVPGHIDVFNRDQKLAGTTANESIKVNTGIPDSAFKF